MGGDSQLHPSLLPSLSSPQRRECRGTTTRVFFTLAHHSALHFSSTPSFFSSAGPFGKKEGMCLQARRRTAERLVPGVLAEKQPLWGRPSISLRIEAFPAPLSRDFCTCSDSLFRSAGEAGTVCSQQWPSVQPSGLICPGAAGSYDRVRLWGKPPGWESARRHGRRRKAQLGWRQDVSRRPSCSPGPERSCPQILPTCRRERSQGVGQCPETRVETGCKWRKPWWGV